MSYVSLNECIKGLGEQHFKEPIALKRDKVTGWHVALSKEPQASLEEICAEVDLLDPNNEDLKKISEVFHYSVDSVVKRERASYEEALRNLHDISSSIASYKITNQSLLYDLALKAAAVNGELLSLHLKNFGLKNQDLFPIALAAVANSEGAVALQIKNYGIKDEEQLFQIAFIVAKRNGGSISRHIKNFGIKDEKKLYTIALRAILADPTIPSLENYGLSSELTLRLKSFADSLSDPTKSHRDAFLSLILEWRKEQFPPFLLVENPDPFVQLRIRKWIVELMFLGLTNEQIEQAEPLFTQLLQLRNPALRSMITAHLPDRYKIDQTIPLKIPKKKDYTQLARLLHVGLQPNSLTYFYSKLEDPLDQELYLLFLLKVRGVPLDEFLRQPNRKAMLHYMRTAIDIVSFGHPELVRGDLDTQLENLFLTQMEGLKVDNFKAAYERTLNKFRKKELIFTYIATLGGDAKPYFKDFIEFILNGTFLDKRYDVPHLKMIFEKFPIEEEWRKGEKDLLIETVEAKAQIPISLADMKVKIITDKHLTIPEDSPLYRCLMGEEREKCLNEATDEIQIKCLQLLDPALTEENKATYLGELDLLCNGTQFQNDVKGWQALMAPVTSRSDYLVSDTDDPNHLFLLGEEVMGSCQKISGGDPKFNKGLVGYLLNGYNRAVVVTDKSGAIVARCLIRLYWDGEKPVLYQERFYTRSSDPTLKSLVDAMCLRRAKALHVPLVTAEGSVPYPKALQITGGRVDIEYVDAIGGVQTSKHTVKKSFWCPD